jgi:uncharacterized protein involved in outer membrane biogenesis
MKKFIKIFLISLLVVLIALFTVPFFFKAEIIKLAKQEINKSVKAQVDWTGFSVSVFRGFPDLKISLKNLSVVGIEKFEGDTLVAFDEFSVKVDLLSVFGGKVNVKSIILDKPVVRAIVLPDSSVNWDITYPSDDVPEVEETVDTSSLEMSVDLREFHIRDGSIHYIDQTMNMAAMIESFSFSLFGNFSMEQTELDVKMGTDALTVDYDGIKYLKNAKLSADALIGADLVKYVFTINNNEIRLNDLILGMEGYFAMPNDEDIELNVKYFTRETSFKSLLSMVPAVYMQDFEGLRASGSLLLEGDAVGIVNDSLLPRVNLALQVKDGQFSYPDLPKSVNNIQIDFKLFYDGVVEDNTRVDLEKFHIEMAGNPVDMSFHAITPFSDMQMNGWLKGKIDLATIADVVPVEEMKMSGIIQSNIELMGKMSDIEKENYEAFKVDGLLEVMNMEVSGKDIPVPVQLNRMSLNFTPKFVELAALDLKMGLSDVQMKGKLENFIPYVFEDDVIRGELEFTSSLLNVNELMPESEEVEEVSADTSALTVVEVPKNIDFKLQTSLKKVIYDQLEIDNILGILIVKDGKVRMDNLAMDLLQGSMIMNGEYNTQDISKPMVNMNLSIKEIDIQSSFYAFNTVEKLVPVAEMCRGKVSSEFRFSSLLDSAMYPVYNSLQGYGSLVTGEVKLENNETFEKIGKLLKKEDLKDSKFKDVNVSFEIRDGRVYVKPFDTKLGASRVTIGGDQGIDQTLNYFMNFSIPRSEFGSSANDLLENLSAQAQSKGFALKPGDDVNVQMRIKGSFSDPEISMDVKESMAKAKEEMKAAVQEKVQEEVQKVKEEVKETFNVEIDKLLKDAEEEAAKIRTTAEAAGQSLIYEAQLQKKQLVKDAGTNPIKKIAAEKAGDALIKTAENQALKLKQEADAKAQAVIDAANKKAEELKSK